jgi:hypothetical protein
LKPWLQTIILLGGVLVVVAGAVLVLVTGFDLIYGALGLLVVAAGIGVMWKFRGAVGDSEGRTAITKGRSYQRPLTPEEQERADYKGRIR